MSAAMTCDARSDIGACTLEAGHSGAHLDLISGWSWSKVGEASAELIALNDAIAVLHQVSDAQRSGGFEVKTVAAGAALLSVGRFLAAMAEGYPGVRAGGRR